MCIRDRATTVREKQELQKKQKTLDIIQQNFTALLDAPEISSDLLPAKKEPVSEMCIRDSRTSSGVVLYFSAIFS